MRIPFFLFIFQSFCLVSWSLDQNLSSVTQAPLYSKAKLKKMTLLKTESPKKTEKAKTDSEDQKLTLKFKPEILKINTKRRPAQFDPVVEPLATNDNRAAEAESQPSVCACEQVPARKQKKSDGTKLPSVLELELDLGAWNQSSQSDFSQRNYGVSGFFHRVNGRMFFHPNWGGGLQYRSSWLTDMPSLPNSGSRTSTTYEDYRFSLFYRTHGVLSTFLTGIELFSEKFSPTDSSRAKLESQGVSGWVQYRFDLWSPAQMQMLGFRVSPLLAHREETAISGAHSRSALWSFESQTHFQVDSHRKIFFRVEHQIEKNQFSGTSQSVDVGRGTTISNSSVQQGSWFISAGLLWSH